MNTPDASERPIAPLSHAAYGQEPSRTGSFMLLSYTVRLSGQRTDHVADHALITWLTMH